MNEKKGVPLLKEKLKLVSERPGVYRMLNADGVVLYVGKAKNLKKRLTNYTHWDKLSTRIRQMVSEVADLMTIETAGETEAFLLENHLIKEFHPYYNILLKDDKSFPYIVLTKEAYPRLVKYRGRRTLKGDYFGPFASGLAVAQTMKELQKIFGLRSCTNSAFLNRTRPCLLYQIKRCAGPCVGLISQEDYMTCVQEAKAFMRGEKTDVQARLTAEMQRLSAKEAYEEAAQVRDKILALNHIQGTARESPLYQTDMIAVHTESDQAAVQIFFYRSGHPEGNVVHFIKHLETDITEQLSSFLMQFYDSVPPPKQILLSLPPEKGLAEALSQKAGHTVVITAPPFRGARRQMMDQALQNAAQSFRQQAGREAIDSNVWEQLRQLVRVPVLDRVEVYDNSHIQGAFAVGAYIVATQDGFQKEAYRRFNIDATKTRTNDDFGMMREVLARRLARGLKEGNLPSLLLIDGGKGQLSSVLEIMRELHIRQVAVLAIAKGEKRNAGLETFFLGSDPNTPIHLDFKGDLIHLLQRLRDEAHRFVITTHRQKRAKNMLHESLTDIEEIGEKRKKALLLHFGSAREIAGASLEQLMRVPGINEKIAKNIYTFYHG